MSVNYQEKLTAAGWEVVDNADHILIRAASDKDAAYARVNKNADGSLHLMTARSSFHTKLAQIIGTPDVAPDVAPDAPAVEGADYTGRTYG